jgi:hypothetical protein
LYTSNHEETEFSEDLLRLRQVPKLLLFRL